MIRTVRPLLAALAAGALLLSGCATQVAGTAQPAGPAVGSSQQAPSAPSSAPTDETSPSEPTAKGTQTEPPTSDAPTSDEPTSDAPTSDEPTAGGDDVQQFASKIAGGMADVTSYEGTMKLQMGSAGVGSMNGELAGTIKDGVSTSSKATMTIEASGQKLEFTMLAIGSKVYVGGDVFLQAVPQAKGKKWIYADPDSKNSVIAQLAKSTSTVQTSNIASFAKFAEAAKSVREVGSKSINGVATTEYEVELDLAKVAGTAAAGSGTATASYYLDQDDRMRRVQVDMDVQGQQVGVVLDMTGYNVPVDISEPAASEVYSG